MPGHMPSSHILVQGVNSFSTGGSVCFSEHSPSRYLKELGWVWHAIEKATLDLEAGKAFNPSSYGVL